MITPQPTVEVRAMVIYMSVYIYTRTPTSLDASSLKISYVRKQVLWKIILKRDLVLIGSGDTSGK